MNEKIFSEIPLRTWRWLGVNDVKTSAQVEEQIIDVADGETKIFAEVNLSAENVARRIKISVGKSARVEFISADAGLGDYSADVEIDLRGDDSAADLEAVYFGDGERRLDFRGACRIFGSNFLRKNKILLQIKC